MTNTVTVVGFLVLVAESVFMWDIESFVDLSFDVVSFVNTLTESLVPCLKLSSVEQIRRILSARLYFFMWLG